MNDGLGRICCVHWPGAAPGSGGVQRAAVKMIEEAELQRPAPALSLLITRARGAVIHP